MLCSEKHHREVPEHLNRRAHSPQEKTCTKVTKTQCNQNKNKILEKEGLFHGHMILPVVLRAGLDLGLGVKGISGGRANLSVTRVESRKGPNFADVGRENHHVGPQVGTLLSAFQKKNASVIRKGEAELLDFPPMASSS